GARRRPGTPSGGLDGGQEPPDEDRRLRRTGHTGRARARQGGDVDLALAHGPGPSRIDDLRLTTVLAVLSLAGVAHAGSSLRTTVLHVVDGDTIRVQLPSGPTAVRLIGIDAPEEHESDRLDRAARSNHRSKATIQALGRLASEFTRRRLLGRSVSLELDAEERDRYGRLLAYVWLDERTLFNAEIVRAGYATAYTVPPNVR